MYLSTCGKIFYNFSQYSRTSNKMHVNTIYLTSIVNLTVKSGKNILLKESYLSLNDNNNNDIIIYIIYNNINNIINKLFM